MKICAYFRAQSDLANCMNKTMIVDEIVYDDEVIQIEWKLLLLSLVNVIIHFMGS
jgi:hypothetical protein